MSRQPSKPAATLLCDVLPPVPGAMTTVVLATATLLGGCSPQPDAEATTVGGGDSELLLDHTAWQQVEADVDPFRNHRPQTVECEGYWEESGQFEVSTNACNYAGLVQGLLVPLQPGDHVQTTLLHDALSLPEGVDASEAHAALAVGDRVVWEAVIPIPSEPGYFNIDAEVDQAWPAGTPAVIHLHNHGLNQYRWLAVERARPGE